MRAECKRNATAKARGEGGGGRGQRGRGEQPSQRRKRALALKHTQQHETTLKPPRLFPFAPFGECSDPLALCPDSLPPPSLLYRLHPLASACIGFSPFASACIGLQALSLPFWVGWSARLSMQLATIGAQIQRKQGIKDPAFFILTLHPFVYDCKSSDL